MAKKNVVIGITGGIAVYKICSLVRLLRQSDIGVDIIMTNSATEFVTPLTFETLSNRPVVTDMFTRQGQWEVGHISLAKKADLFVVAPATANIIGKFACGIADDMLSTTLMATTAPIVMCPAMNTNMYNNVATQSNIATLASRGVTFVDSATGQLACGDSGKGRLAEPADIYDAIMAMLYPNRDLFGKNVLITLGATSEQLDDVRCITNHSSGAMGSAIVSECIARGATVTVVAGSHSVAIDSSAVVHNVTTTDNMHSYVMDNLSNQHIAIMVAAPCDYRPVQVAKSKIKGDKVTLELVKNVDIASCVGHSDNKPYLVVFSAETDNGVSNAKKKLACKNADLAVLNIVAGGDVFGKDSSAVTLIDNNSCTAYDTMPKSQVAKLIVDKVVASL